jgi:RNA polymerase sigma-70 factor, ECF subfamily
MKDEGVNPHEGNPGQTSLTLLEKVRAQEQEAWDRLVELYTPLVWHWCRICGLQLADMEEVTQDVFTAVARGISTFHRDQEGDTFRGWLRSITRTKIIDHLPPVGGVGEGGSGAQRRLLEVAAPDPDAQASADAEAMERNILYRRAVQMIESSFEPSTRRAFWLLIAGRQPRDVAADLALSVSAVYTAKARILKRLREEFQGILEISDAI